MGPMRPDFTSLANSQLSSYISKSNISLQRKRGIDFYVILITVSMLS